MLHRVPSSGVATMQDDRTSWIFPLSAKTLARLELERNALLEFLKANDVSLPDLSFTLSCHRFHHPFRVAVVAGSKVELIEKLRKAIVSQSGDPEELPRIGVAFLAPESITSDIVVDCTSNDAALRDLYDRYLVLHQEIPQDSSVRSRLDSILFQLALFDRLQQLNLCPAVATGSGLSCLAALSAAGLCKTQDVAHLLTYTDARLDQVERVLQETLAATPDIDLYFSAADDLDELPPDPVDWNTDVFDADPVCQNRVQTCSRYITDHDKLGSSDYLVLPEAYQWVHLGGLRPRSEPEPLEIQGLRKPMYLPGTSPSCSFNKEIAKRYKAGYRISWLDYHEAYMPALSVIHRPLVSQVPSHQYWIEHFHPNALHHRPQSYQEDLYECTDSGPIAIGRHVEQALFKEEVDQIALWNAQPSPPRYSLLQTCTRFVLVEGKTPTVEIYYETPMSQALVSSLIQGHRLLGFPVAPISLFTEMAVQAAHDMDERCRHADLSRSFLSSNGVKLKLESFEPLIPNMGTETQMFLICARSQALHESERDQRIPTTLDVSVYSKDAGERPETKHLLFECQVMALPDDHCVEPESKMDESTINREIIRMEERGERISHDSFYSLISNVADLDGEIGYRGVTEIHRYHDSDRAVSRVLYTRPSKLQAGKFIFLPPFLDSLFQGATWIHNVPGNGDENSAFVLKSIRTMVLPYQALSCRSLDTDDSHPRAFMVCCWTQNDAEQPHERESWVHICTSDVNHKVAGKILGMKFKRVSCHDLRGFKAHETGSVQADAGDQADPASPQ